MKRFDIVSPTESGKEFLQNSSILSGLPLDSFEELYDKLEWLKLTTGNILFQQNEPGDSLYILVSGRLGAFRRNAEGKNQLLGDITPGESLGEMAVLTGENRSATVQALRDSLLVRLSSESFQTIIESNPQTLIRMNRVLIDRLRSMYETKPSNHVPAKIFALFPVSQKAPVRAFCQQLQEELDWWGEALHLNRQIIQQKFPTISLDNAQHEDLEKLIFWLHEQEQVYQYILLEADEDNTGWSKFCLEHCDLKLLVGIAAQQPEGYILEEQQRIRRQQLFRHPTRLILIQSDNITLPRNTIHWTEQVQNDDHHHVRLQHRQDVKSLVRFLLGKTISLALAGGGALGMSHIGVFRALQERGIPIDLGCGASAGANVSGQITLGWDYKRIWEHTKRTLPTSVWYKVNIPPIVSFMRPEIPVIAMNETFGDMYIEDMWRKYFCSSSNLTRGSIEIYNKGPMVERITASCSLAPMFPPYVSDSGDLLVDGAVLANLPALQVKDFVEGKVIAVNVIPTLDSTMCSGLPQNKSSLRMTYERFRPIGRQKFPTIFDIMMRSIFLNGVYDAEIIRQEVDLYIEPPVEQFSIFNMGPFDTIVNIGYHTARPLIDRWIESDPEVQKIIDIERAV